MQVGASGTTGACLGAERLTASDFVTFFDFDGALFHMGIDNVGTVYLLDFDVIAITASASAGAAAIDGCFGGSIGIIVTIYGRDDFARGCCDNRAGGSGWRKIRSLVSAVSIRSALIVLTAVIHIGRYTDFAAGG